MISSHDVKTPAEKKNNDAKAEEMKENAIRFRRGWKESREMLSSELIIRKTVKARKKTTRFLLVAFKIFRSRGERKKKEEKRLRGDLQMMYVLFAHQFSGRFSFLFQSRSRFLFRRKTSPLHHKPRTAKREKSSIRHRPSRPLISLSLCTSLIIVFSFFQDHGFGSLSER